MAAPVVAPCAGRGNYCALNRTRGAAGGGAGRGDGWGRVKGVGWVRWKGVGWVGEGEGRGWGGGTGWGV